MISLPSAACVPLVRGGPCAHSFACPYVFQALIPIAAAPPGSMRGMTMCICYTTIIIIIVIFWASTDNG